MIKHVLGIFILLCLSVLHASGQSTANHFSSQYFEQQRFAHRGGYANGPENTLKTILNNIDSGINALEIDVQLTGDGQLVLFNDHGVDRLLQYDLGLTIDQLSLQELQEIPFRDAIQGLQYICSLEELIDTLASVLSTGKINDFILEIDFKPHGDRTKKGVDALLEIIDQHVDVFEYGLYNHFFVSTFYPEVLKELHDKNRQIATAFAINNSPDQDRFKAKLAIIRSSRFVKKYEVDIIEPNMCMTTSRFVRKWHNRGILINARTANTECEKEYLENLSIAYTTNCPGTECDQVGKPKKWCKQCN